MKLLFFFIFINQIILAQIRFNYSDSCFCEPTMKGTNNFFTNPSPLPNKNYDSLRIYVLPDKPMSKRNVYSNRSTHYVNHFNSVKYQKAVIANYSTDSLVFNASNNKGIYIIQEALDSNNNWRPIEYLDIRRFCTVGSRHWYSLKSLEFCNLAIPKYCGAYKTKIRLKIKTTQNIIYSTPFKGSIHYEQFYLDPIKLKESGEYPSLLEYENRNVELKLLNKSMKNWLYQENK